MRYHHLVLIPIAILLALTTGCPQPVGPPVPDVPEIPAYMNFTPPADGYETEDALLCTIYFYTGDNIGGQVRPTGPQISLDEGQTWDNTAWDIIITSKIDVGPWGKWAYSACGNGVLASTDGGRNWRLTGGWEQAEIQDVKIGPESPLVVWAAGSYGLFYSEDGAKTWTRPGDPQPFRYVGTALPDRENGDRVLIGTEVGLYITDDRAQTYRRVGPEVPIRSILQDIRNPEWFWLGTDGMGLMKSEDRGENWMEIPGPGDVVNGITQNPDTPEWLVCGIKHGISFSMDDGTTWNEITEGFGEFSPVYATLFDKDDPQKMYAAARDGFFFSEDGGLTWGRKYNDEGNGVLQNALIIDLWQGELYRGDEEPGSTEPGTLAIDTDPPEGDDHRENFAPGYEDRSQAIIDLLVQRTEDRLADLDEGRHVDLMSAIAYIREGHANDALWDDIRVQFEDWGHSMFHSFPAITFYLYTQEFLPNDIKEILRENLVPHYSYRGDTENHWLMHYTGLFLASQSWPESTESEWYTGRTTQENYDEAAGWLNEWTRITSTIGQGEFDSPAYYITYMAPTIVLYEFADDPVIKRQAGMIADLLLADMGAESLDGRYGGGHSRMYDEQVIMGSEDRSTAFFYLFFGDIEIPETVHPWIITAAYSEYRCPQSITDIALNRDEPYVHTEVKRVRNCMRYIDELNPPVYKYNYMTPDYALGSLQGGILQPIQQHTWDVTWIGSADNTTCFSLHPYYSAYELAIFFPEDPHTLTASVQSQKSTYTNPDKLNSSSPFERTFQHEDTLIAAYNIPDDATHPHVTLYVPGCLNAVEENGWILGHDGNTYVAIHYFDEGEWIDEPVETFPPSQRLKIPAGQTAFVVEIGRVDEDGSFETFRENILSLALPTITVTEIGPSIRYTNRHGVTLEYHWDGDIRRLNGTDWQFPTDRLFVSRFMDADVDTGVIGITGDTSTRILDFNNLTIEELPN